MAEGDTGGIRPGGSASGYVPFYLPTYMHTSNLHLHWSMEDSTVLLAEQIEKRANSWIKIGTHSPSARRPMRITPFACVRRRSWWSSSESLQSNTSTWRSWKPTCTFSLPFCPHEPQSRHFISSTRHRGHSVPLLTSYSQWRDFQIPRWRAEVSVFTYRTISRLEERHGWPGGWKMVDKEQC